MNIWDRVKRIFVAAFATVASVGEATVSVSQPPPTVQQDHETSEVVNIPVNYSEEPAPYEAVMVQLSREFRLTAESEASSRAMLAGLESFTNYNGVTLKLIDSEKQINYAEVHSQDPNVLKEKIWELYDIYFDSLEIPNSDFKTEREKFIIEIMGWFAEFTVTSIAGGVLGNWAYDKLKERIQRRQEKSRGSISRYYEKLGKDINSLLEAIAQTEMEGMPIHVYDLSSSTGISKEIVRSWLKCFGFTHYSNCTWISTKKL